MRYRLFLAFPVSLIFALVVLVYFAAQRYEMLLAQR
jgi:hypothetical protein